MQTYQTYFKREFDKKRENSGVLARFVLFLAGITYRLYRNDKIGKILQPPERTR